MSAVHTPGRLKVQHPHAGERGFELAFEPGLEQVCQDITEANARRLAACWNACEGISTDLLESAPYKDSAAFMAYLKVESQRDELLEALKRLLAIVADSRGVTGYHRNGNEAEWDEFADVDAARAAIAKAEGSL